MQRGEVWWADFGMPRGSAPASNRPALIISANRFNRSNLQTVTVVAITTNLRYADLPGNILLPANQGKLERDSVINVSQVATLDRKDLSKLVGKLDDHLISEVEYGLRLALNL
ncbi:MAG: type II toxin-antitoxin system PemK/MazF family toxin [Candidatus Dormibacteraceae bacterium]